MTVQRETCGLDEAQSVRSASSLQEHEPQTAAQKAVQVAKVHVRRGGTWASSMVLPRMWRRGIIPDMRCTPKCQAVTIPLQRPMQHIEMEWRSLQTNYG